MLHAALFRRPIPFRAKRGGFETEEFVPRSGATFFAHGFAQPLGFEEKTEAFAV
jgi:hypothetical protein